jgi:arginine decarboxylase
MTPLVDEIRAVVQRQGVAFYAPGHKQGQGGAIALTDLIGHQALRADLPELPELDNLFAPQGAIAASQELAAQTFGAEQTWFLANGSTCGILAAILATCEPGQKIILPRNVHQSAIAALILSGAMPVFVTPHAEIRSLTPEQVASALEQHPDAKAVVMVYPTYYGVCEDIRAIASLTHQFNVPLLVDEAHGAHFAFHPELPISALEAGADLAVQSTHKTLSAMTQASMLHVQGNRVDRDRISKSLQLVQSTSPSYLLLASLDAAQHQMATEGRALMKRTLELADQARSRLYDIGLKTLDPEQVFALDRTRLTVIGINGFAIDEALHQKFSITAELPSQNSLTFIISLGNTQQDIDQLIQAFAGLEIRTELDSQPPMEMPSIVSALSPRQAFFARTEKIALDQSCDRISAELICPYPPGIPVLMPGEQITQPAIDTLKIILNSGGFITGCSDPNLETILAIANQQ